MPKAPELSVILLSFNRLELTKSALVNLLDAVAGIDTEILVVDNASTDGTMQHLATVQHDQVRVIQNQENLYFGGGNNVGLDQARGKFVLFTQNDFTFASHSIGLMLELCQELPDCGMVGVGGGLVTEHGLTELSDWWKNPLRNFHYIPVDFISGCCMMAEREFMTENGIRFDEGYRLYWEDVDISHQMVLAGRTLYMLNNSLACTDHLRSGSITPLLGVEERERIRAESNDYYVNKWSDTALPRQPELTYGFFGTKFVNEANVSNFHSGAESSEAELEPYTNDISAIQPFEYLEMAGKFQEASQGLQKLWLTGESNYMALRNLCRIRRTFGGPEEITGVVQTLRTVLERDMPELFRDKLIKHYQIALGQLAELAEEQQDHGEAITFLNELIQSARAQETKDKCLQKIADLKSSAATNRTPYGVVHD